MLDEIHIIEKLASIIEDIKHGLDPDVLAYWYDVIESEAKALCPEELKSTISVRRDPIITLKFELRSSIRAVPFIIEAIENNLPSMPFATRLYFQKLEEIIKEEAKKLRKP